jgi:phosphoglycolate phosphatase-like HAD superfamily hydrolase
MTATVVELVRQARCLVFDFDGTLVDSNPIKWRAFEECFSDYPGSMAQILEHCRGNPHSPRWEKFRTVYERILKIPYDQQVEDALVKRFEEETTRQIVEAPEIPGASGFLSQVQGSHSTALLSSTPHSTLLQILEGRGWTDYFQRVQGAPVDKSEWLRQLPNQAHGSSRQILFFGDTLEDAQAAQSAGCPFVAVGRLTPGALPGVQMADFTGLLNRSD